MIGAGAAGLSAAWRLAAAGCRVTLYEAEARAGGRLRTDTVADVRLDATAQLLASYYRQTLRLLREAGLADRLARAPGRDAFWRNGRAHTLTYGSVASLAVSGAMPASLKLRLLAKYVPFLTRHATRLDAAEPAAGVGATLDTESIAEWGRREVGSEFVELLAYPLLAASAAMTPEQTSAGYYHALASAGLSIELFAVRGGMSALVDGLMQALRSRGAELRASTSVERVTPEAGGVAIDTGDGSVRYEAAVIAVPAPRLDRLLSPAPELAGWLAAAAAATAPVVSVAVVLDAPLGVNYFGLSVPRTVPPGEVIAAVCVQENKPGGLVQPGAGALVAFAAPAAAQRLATQPPERVLDEVLPALEVVYPRLRRRVVRARVYSFADGAVLFPAGSLRRLREYDPDWLPRTVALAGDYLVSSSVEGAVRSGARAAARLLGDVA